MAVARLSLTLSPLFYLKFDLRGKNIWEFETGVCGGSGVGVKDSLASAVPTLDATNASGMGHPLWLLLPI